MPWVEIHIETATTFIKSMLRSLGIRRQLHVHFHNTKGR